MGGANVTALSELQGGTIVRSLREEYEEQTAGGREVPPDLLQELLTNKYRKVLNELDESPVVLSEEFGGLSAHSTQLNDDKTENMLQTLTLKGTQFLEMMNFFDSEEAPDFSGEEISPPSPQVIDPWTQTMDMRSGEVEFLLRRPLNNDDDINGTLAAGEAGLQFLDELNIVSTSLKINRGTLSRWLLPFDSSTSIQEQQSSVQSVESNTPVELQGKISAEQLQYLVGGVNGVRQLVRVKIADDNDLETATAAVRTTTLFLSRLKKAAQDLTESGQPTSPYELLKSHQFV